MGIRAADLLDALKRANGDLATTFFERSPQPDVLDRIAAVSIISDPPATLPAPVPDVDRPDGCPALAAMPKNDRIEIAIDGGVTVGLPGDILAERVIAIAGGLSRRRR